MFEGAIRHGTLLAVAVLIVCILGIVAALRVPVQMIPDLEIRTISVRTNWAGATPQDVEKEILIEQEEYLRDIPSMMRMVSEAGMGGATIELEFPFGVDINEALIRVNNALSQVPSYPENVDEPRLYTSSFSNNAFIFLRVEPLPNVDIDMTMMLDFVDDQVRVRLERVPGVSEVSVRGGAPRQVQIEVDAGRLAESGLTFGDLRAAIRSRNRDISGGDLDSGKRRYLLRTVGRFDSLEAIEDVVVAERDGAFIHLRDLATVRLDHFEETARSYSNGKETLSLAIRRETGSNVIAIMDAVIPAIAQINREVLEPAGMKMFISSEDVRYVRDSAMNVWQNLILGAILATGVMYLFLRSGATTMIGVIGIPICTIAAFLGLLLTGRTINVISLAGIAFAIGMTLDNSIVVLEAIQRARSEGMRAAEAALTGVRRVWPAILASTLTTVLVFAPILFIQEEAGQLYADVAAAISASILASMLVAITVLPSASARLTMSGSQEGDARPGPVARISALVGRLIATRAKRVTCLVATIAATVLSIGYLTPPAEYLPEGEEAKTFALMIPPPGYNLPEMDAIALELNDYFTPFLDQDPAKFAAGESEVPALKFLLVIASPQFVRVIAETIEPTHIDALMKVLNERFRSYPGMRAFASRGSIITSNDGGTRSVNVEVSGTDLRDIYEAASSVYRTAREVFAGGQINSTPSSLELGQPMIEIRPRWERAAELGFSGADLGYTVAALTDGAYVDEFYLNGDDKIDMFLYGTESTDQKLANLPNLPIHTPSRSVVPLSSVADIVETVATDTIRRVDGRRTVTLNIIAPREVALETAVGIVREEVVGKLTRSGEVPQGVALEISGASDQLDATREALSGNFAMALMLCYLLLVAIFTHWGYPLVIMATVPLGIAGGIVGLWILNQVGAGLPLVGLPGFPHQPFDMITMMGFLILLGTVVNNPILIVDEMRNRLQQSGVDPLEAVKQAVDARLRPVLMSTTTTMFGLAPLVFLPGAGTELYRGLGAIVLFGLLFAMIVTLTFLPALLVTIMDLRKALASLTPRASSTESHPDHPPLPHHTRERNQR